MAAELNETITEILPHIGLKLIYFTATKAATSDFMDFDDYQVVLFAHAMTDGAEDTCAIGSDGSITRRVTLGSGIASGAVKGFAIVV